MEMDEGKKKKKKENQILNQKKREMEEEKRAKKRGDVSESDVDDDEFSSEGEYDDEGDGDVEMAGESLNGNMVDADMLSSDEDGALEDWYEEKLVGKAKKNWEKQSKATALPIKTSDGRVSWVNPKKTNLPYSQQKGVHDEDEDDDSDEGSSVEEDEQSEELDSDEDDGAASQREGRRIQKVKQVADRPEMTPLEEMAEKEKWLLKQKELVAGFSSLVLEDPEAYVSNVGVCWKLKLE